MFVGTMCLALHRQTKDVNHTMAIVMTWVEITDEFKIWVDVCRCCVLNPCSNFIIPHLGR